ncbi:MAG: twin-arginine translocation signal domain-containing protein, partial [Mangrovibacterium sp.]|nr:twin-arginine translocation signal domain-containing protein [Mangrovibacterium sp.]
MNRRDFIQTTALAGTATILPFKEVVSGEIPEKPGSGSQRLSLQKLLEWENRGYGMFLHFGMSTFDGEE